MVQRRSFERVLVANRGEIAIRVFRACTELGKSTIAIYSEQDMLSLHRYKADEAYRLGQGLGPIQAYLDIPGIIEVARREGVDAIHPGYGFLSENAEFARACAAAGIVFIGPKAEHLEMFGDKVQARTLAEKAGLPVPPGTPEPIAQLQDALLFAKQHGYPLIVKAVSGGGGRGMRVVRNRDELTAAVERARSEALAAFGNGAVYLEKYIESPRHIEVQILADGHGSVLHLLERDCSVQRRHQKVVEVAPSLSLSPGKRAEICDAAVRLMQTSGYVNAGTVEFLVDQAENFYFIEVNPRVQVEHTITELITGVDIVQAQVRIAEGATLAEIGLSGQAAVQSRGYAIQCRITSEDPENDFLPDTGRVAAYRSAGGFGVRLDGNCYQGATISPYYDSLLVKLCTHALTFEAAAVKASRSLREFRIRGVKTNIPFLENVVTHPKFLAGEVNTGFIADHPELFHFAKRQDRANRLLRYIGDVVVGAGPLGRQSKKPVFTPPAVPAVDLTTPPPPGSRDALQAGGMDGLRKWMQAQQPRLLVTDTTFRDAHQSLLATRVRTKDMLVIADATARLAPNLFSLEMWGGATFDTAMRFLKEDPWERLELLRARIPNICFQMLLRGANAVGYANYPDNVITAFVREAAAAGIDIFRIFDSLNWLPGMQLAIEAARDAGAVAEAAICYTGDILDPSRTKYTLAYYVNLAKELERAGAQILAIKDMSGLLKPTAAYQLVQALRQETGLPIHLHTHDSAGNGIAALLRAAEAGVDVVDAALSSMSGVTSQPSLNALVAALGGSGRETGLELPPLQQLADYWAGVREYYAPFESGLKAPSAAVYLYELPGGQYSNLQQQAAALGLSERWPEVLDAYATVNRMLGDIIKVTPSSKAVGDFALWMVKNNLTEADVYARGEQLAFPESVVQLLKGMMGQPPGGWPAELQRIVLKGQEPLTCRPGELLEPVDFQQVAADLAGRIGRQPSQREVLSSVLYPAVFAEFLVHQQKYSDTSFFDTPTFFHGLRLGEEVEVEIEQGKTLVIKLVSEGQTRPDGTRDLTFELNGQAREVRVVDPSAQVTVPSRPKAAKGDLRQVGSSMPGKVLRVLVEAGDRVKKGEQLLITEAMKMETTLTAPMDGKVAAVHVQEGDGVEAGDLVLSLDFGDV